MICLSTYNFTILIRLFTWFWDNHKAFRWRVDIVKGKFSNLEVKKEMLNKIIEESPIKLWKVISIKSICQNNIGYKLYRFSPHFFGFFFKSSYLFPERANTVKHLQSPICSGIFAIWLSRAENTLNFAHFPI